MGDNHHLASAAPRYLSCRHSVPARDPWWRRIGYPSWWLPERILVSLPCSPGSLGLWLFLLHTSITSIKPNNLLTLWPYKPNNTVNPIKLITRGRAQIHFSLNLHLYALTYYLRLTILFELSPQGRISIVKSNINIVNNTYCYDFINFCPRVSPAMVGLKHKPGLSQQRLCTTEQTNREHLTSTSLHYPLSDANCRISSRP